MACSRGGHRVGQEARDLGRTAQAAAWLAQAAAASSQPEAADRRLLDALEILVFYGEVAEAQILATRVAAAAGPAARRSWLLARWISSPAGPLQPRPACWRRGRPTIGPGTRPWTPRPLPVPGRPAVGPGGRRPAARRPGHRGRAPGRRGGGVRDRLAPRPGRRSNRQTAAELYVSVKTVEFHLGHIFDKLGIRSRKDLITRTGAPSPGRTTTRAEPRGQALATRLGYDSVWTSESLGSEALTPLAWYGARTSRIKLGTSVIQLSARTITLAILGDAELPCGQAPRQVTTIDPTDYPTTTAFDAEPPARTASLKRWIYLPSATTHDTSLHKRGWRLAGYGGA